MVQTDTLKSKNPLLDKLEHSDAWEFCDAFELLCFYTHVLANAFESGRSGFEKIENALIDVWTTIEDSIADGKIRVKSGNLMDLSAGPMLIENSNRVVIDRKGFLSLYCREKEKMAHYLSFAGLKIHQEEFLDRLANSKSLKKLAPIVEKVKIDRLRDAYISYAVEKIKVNPKFNFDYFKNDYGLNKIIRGSGLSESKQPKKSTLEGWIRKARKKVIVRVGTISAGATKNKPVIRGT